MQIKTLSITRKAGYQQTTQQPEAFSGQVHLEGNSDYRPDITVHLNEHQIIGILEIVAPALVKAIDTSLEALRLDVEKDILRLSAPEGETIDANSEAAAE